MVIFHNSYVNVYQRVKPAIQSQSGCAIPPDPEIPRHAAEDFDKEATVERFKVDSNLGNLATLTIKKCDLRASEMVI